MEKLKRIPNKGSVIRYLGGETSPNCHLIIGELYTVLGKDRNEYKDEYAWIRMGEGSTWYIRGGKDENDFDKYEVVEEFLGREDLIEIKDEKELRIEMLEETLKKILEITAEIENTEEVVKVRNLAENAIMAN